MTTRHIIAAVNALLCLINVALLSVNWLENRMAMVIACSVIAVAAAIVAVVAIAGGRHADA